MLASRTASGCAGWWLAGGCWQRHCWLARQWLPPLAKPAPRQMSTAVDTLQTPSRGARPLFVLACAGKTFLDLIAEQIKHTRQAFGSKVRFVLMNRRAQAP